MELQHLNVKMFVENTREADLDPLIPVFHSWIQGRVFDELLLDVADYRHVHGGPGVVLIGHEADYSVDNTGNRLGVRYNRKAALGGSNVDRLRQAARAALTACERLESDPRLDGKLRFDGKEIELFVNDRLSTADRELTREAVKSEFVAFFQKLFHGSDYLFSFGNDPRKLFAVSVKATRAFPVSALLANLNS